MTTLRKLCVALAATAALGAAAQQRIAVVNVNEIYTAMPDRILAQKQLNDLSEQYNKEYKAAQSDFDAKFEAYQSLDASTPATIKERRVQELQTSNERLGRYLDKAEADLKALEAELDAPIRQRLATAIQAVGQEGGYTYIIDLSANAVPYVGADAIDVTALVKKKLGL